jgi:hypothetical protein
MFYFSNRFWGQKLFDRERLVSWSIVMMENPIVGPKFRLFLCIASCNASVLPHNMLGLLFGLVE